MHEHRLIERMVRLLQSELDRLSTEETLDPDFILAVVDFFRTYADRTHHGKEEDILVVALEKKTLDDGLRSIMDELIEEHIYARTRVGRLLESREHHLNGDPGALELPALEEQEHVGVVGVVVLDELHVPPLPGPVERLNPGQDDGLLGAQLFTPLRINAHDPDPLSHLY